MKKRYYLALCALTFAGPVHAEETIHKIEAIEVKGAAAALEQRAAAPAAKVVLEREEVIKLNDRTVGDVLRRLPGISYSGPPGVTKDVRMRGMDKGYTQILINGERMGSAKPDRQMSVSRIPADMIERIEIIRTPTADIDSQGIGGTINIILKEAERKPFGQLTIGTGYTGEVPNGARTTGAVGAQFGGGSGNFSYLFSANVVERAENKGEVKQKFNGDGSLKEILTKDETSDVLDLTLAPRFTWRTNIGKLTLDPFYVRTEEDKDRPEYKFKADGSANGAKLEVEDKVNELTRLRLGWEHGLADNFRLSWRTTVQQASEDKNKDVRELNADGTLKKTTAEDKLNEETEFSTGLEADWLVNDYHAVKFGIEWQNRKSEAEKTLFENGALKAANAKDLFTIDEQRFTVYASDEWSITDKHLLTPGLRLEFYETDSEQTGGATVSNTDEQLNPSLQYRYQLTPANVLRAGVARTLRLPKFDELNPFLTTNDGDLSKPDVGGTPDLTPETAVGYDLGLEHYFAAKKGVIGSNFFYRDITDLIEPVTSLEGARWVSRPQNVGDAKLWGAEFDASRSLDFISLPNLTIRANYTWLDSEIDAADGSTRPMKDIPDYIANIGFDQEIPQWKLTFGATLNVLGPIESESPKDALTEIKSESRKELVDLYIRKQLASNLELSLTAYNIFEDDKSSEKRILNGDGSLKESETGLETSVRTVMLTLETRW